MNKHTLEELKEWQKYPLSVKVLMSRERIRQFVREYGVGGVYISFSGGKDSTVLLHIAREMYPDIKAIFSNTGLEYPEIVAFARSFPNIQEVRPKVLRESRYGKPGHVITSYDVFRLRGYPVISKLISNAVYYSRKRNNGTRWQKLNGEYGAKAYDFSRWMFLYNLPVNISDECCSALKKHPLNIARLGARITGQMAAESVSRKSCWLQSGCNSYSNDPHSAPLAFWTEQDILQYIVEKNIEICSVYGDLVYCDRDGNEYDARKYPAFVKGKIRTTLCHRTGCVYCPFGVHLEKGETRFQRLKRTHPRLYEYAIGGGEWGKNPIDTTGWDWHCETVWLPNKKGLGLGKVFDMINDAKGKKIIRYE